MSKLNHQMVWYFSFLIALVLDLSKGQTCTASSSPTTMGSPSVGTHSLSSSLQRSNRNYTCPDESVVYSCVVYVYGQCHQLQWRANDATLGIFKTTDRSGTGFSCHGIACTFKGCFIFSGVLDNISHHDGYSFFHSTLTVTPGYFSNASMLTRGADTQPLMNITCRISGHNPLDLKPLPFRIAGLPNISVSGTNCSYDCPKNCSVDVKLSVPENTDTDLDYYTVVLYDGNRKLQTKLVKLLENQIENVCTRFCDIIPTSDNISVKVTAVDKCGQQSPQPLMIQCSENSVTGNLSAGEYKDSILTAIVLVFVVIIIYINYV